MQDTFLFCSLLTLIADGQKTGRHLSRKRLRRAKFLPPRSFFGSKDFAESDIGCRVKMRPSSAGPGRNFRNVAYGRRLGPSLLPYSHSVPLCQEVVPDYRDSSPYRFDLQSINFTTRRVSLTHNV